MGSDRTARLLTDAQRALLEALLSGTAPRLLAYVRRMYGGTLDAEEIVAETFCRAAANFDALTRAERPELYLLAVVRNLCRDGFRRQRPLAAPDALLDARPDGRPSAEERTVEDERLAAVREAVAALPEREREIVVLRMSAGLKFEQIAELLAIPVGTALSRMHAAMTRLRERVCDE